MTTPRAKAEDVALPDHECPRGDRCGGRQINGDCWAPNCPMKQHERKDNDE